MMMRIDLKTSETLQINSLDPRNSDKEKKASPAEELTEVILSPEDPIRTVKIGSQLTRENKIKLIELLGSSTDVFVWSHQDMPGIDPSVISHKLNANPSSRPIKQKRIAFNIERYQVMREEIEKLLKASFLREVQYPD